MRYFCDHQYVLGTVVGDPVELNSIDAVLGKNRKRPLLVGSLKANIAHAEPASGLNSISKLLIAMETGVLAPTINHKVTRKAITGLVEGRLRVVTEKTPWPTDKRIASVNSFGFGGANGHILLEANPKLKTNTEMPSIPVLVCVSSRTREGVELQLKRVLDNPKDLEYISLFHNIYR